MNPTIKRGSRFSKNHRKCYQKRGVLKKIKGGDDHIGRGLPTEGRGKGLKPFAHYTTIPISEGIISKFCIIIKRYQVNQLTSIPLEIIRKRLVFGWLRGNRS